MARSFALPLAAMVALAAHAFPMADPVVASALAWSAGVLFGWAASDSRSVTAAAGGALGMLAFDLLAPSGRTLAGAVLFVLVFADRTGRVMPPARRLAHTAVAAGAGAGGALLVTTFGHDTWSMQTMAAYVMAGALATFPRLFEADDALAFRLDALADELPEPARRALREAAALRRDEARGGETGPQAADLRRTFDAILRLAEERRGLAAREAHAAGRHGMADRARELEERLHDHVATLRRLLGVAGPCAAAEPHAPPAAPEPAASSEASSEGTPRPLDAPQPEAAAEIALDGPPPTA